MADRFADNLALYEAMVASRPEVERKGKKNPYTSLNGHMFSFIDAGGTVCLRFAAERRDALAAAFGTGPVEQYGAVMKDYVALPDEVLKTGRAAELFAESLVHVASLKPKPTKR